MAGYFNRPSWSEIAPDFKGAKLMANLVGKPMGDDGLFRVIINFLESEGLTVVSPEDVLSQPNFMPVGCLTIATPDQQAIIDIERGLKVARALGSVDVGQAVVVQQGLVLGVEALEGSDNLIARCGKLQESKSQSNLPGGIFVKVLKPTQDTRVDRSVIGPQTVQSVYKAGLRGIAVEANRVILLNSQASIALANQYNIFITGV
jgi:UDP-2,3-diacylglucosamine hydrolase